MYISIDIIWLEYVYYTYKEREDFNAKKLTITIAQEVYEGLYNTIGSRKISKFVKELVRPHVVRPNLELAYSKMAKDKKREAEALDWAETTLKDIAHEKR